MLSISDTHTPATDTSGDILAERITAAGHVLAARAIVRDDAAVITAQCEAWIDDPAIDPIVSTGGTGLTGRDVTPKALAMLPGACAIPGFGELFRWISYMTIGTSTVQSRACEVVAAALISSACPARTARPRTGGTTSSSSSSTAATGRAISSS